MTPRLREYLDVGRRSANGLSAQLKRLGFAPTRSVDVVDFGCGLGRTLRHFNGHSWRFAGTDIDPRLIDWCREALPGVDWCVNASTPPLPFDDGSFDVLWAVSVFTHFAEPEQSLWAADVARVLRPGGFALISLMGPHAMGAFPELAAKGRRPLEEHGFFFQAAGETFNQRGAFHTRSGVERLFGGALRLESWLEGGLDGFQDLAVLERC